MATSTVASDHLQYEQVNPRYARVWAGSRLLDGGSPAAMLALFDRYAALPLEPRYGICPLCYRRRPRAVYYASGKGWRLRALACGDCATAV